jgi:hypothetical protein
MGLRFTRLINDDEGETHLIDIEAPTEREPRSGVSRVEIPLTRLVYVEYPTDQVETMPGWHSTPPPRHFMVSVRGGFEVTTTSGDTKRFAPGDWILCDDLEGKGHITKAVGEGPRVNLVLDVPDDWQVPGA